VGLTDILAVVDPSPHTKLVAPVAVNVVDPPAQMIDGEAAILIVGDALTFTVIDSLDEQPLELVPVTV